MEVHTQDESKLLSAEETAEFLGTTTGTLAAWRSTKKYDLPYVKIGALVRISVRRIKFAMASGCPYQRDFALAHAQLVNAAAAR